MLWSACILPSLPTTHTHLLAPSPGTQFSQRPHANPDAHCELSLCHDGVRTNSHIETLSSVRPHSSCRTQRARNFVRPAIKERQCSSIRFRLSPVSHVDGCVFSAWARAHAFPAGNIPKKTRAFVVSVEFSNPVIRVHSQNRVQWSSENENRVAAGIPLRRTAVRRCGARCVRCDRRQRGGRHAPGATQRNGRRSFCVRGRRRRQRQCLRSD